MASQKTLEHYLRQLRLIEEHREKKCEQNVRGHYYALMKDLQAFLGTEYAELAEDDKLTYEILHKKGQYARFVEEVGNRMDKVSRKVSKEIADTVHLTYQKCFEGMVEAVTKSKDYDALKVNLKGVRAITPDQVKNAVSNTFLEDALEKNHKESIYTIKQQLGVGLSQGDRMSTMAKRLSDQIDTDYNKSVRIIRTESHRVREAGFQDASMRMKDHLEEADSDYVLVKTWKTMKDGAVRPQRMKGKKGSKKIVIGKGPDHVKMHGVTVLVDEPFDLGGGITAMTPGQSGVAGHDINCRCVVIRDLMTKEEYTKKTGKAIKETKKEDPAKKYEEKETELLQEQTDLKAQKEKLEQRKTNLESYEYKGIWKDTVTPANYAEKKDSIQSKKDYYIERMDKFKGQSFNNMLNQYGTSIDFDDIDEYLKNNIGGIFTRKNFGLDKASLKTYADISDEEFKKYLRTQVDEYCKMLQAGLDGLDDFAAQGKAYLKIMDELDDINKKQVKIAEDLKSVRKSIMKAKEINVDAMQKEIDDITAQIKVLSKNNVTFSVKSKLNSFDEDLFEKAWKKAMPNDDYTDIKGTLKRWGDDSFKDFINWYLSPEDGEALKYELRKLMRPDAKVTAKIKALQKELTEKRDELEKIFKRYGLEEDKFSQARKDAAYWFTDKNGGAKGADKILRNTSGEVWRNASNAQKDAAYEYTRSYSKFNEPLRGIEYGTSKFVGIENIDFDTIGINYGGYAKGEVKKLIDDLTDMIDKSTYDVDFWVQRGCNYRGMDKFFNIDLDDFTNLTESQMQAKLLGTMPTEYGFMSTGVSRGSGLNTSGTGITLNIYAPKGTKMLYCEPFSAFGRGSGRSWDGVSTQSVIGHEAEMLLQRNTKFRVTKVEKNGNRWYIDMEVISQKR